MKWSVALFGHEKPRYYVQDEKTGLNIYDFVEDPGEVPKGMKKHLVEGWEKRAEPGDFIVAKPDRFWKTIDRKQHAEIVKSIRDKKYIVSKKEEILVEYIKSLSEHVKSIPDSYQRALKRFDRLFMDCLRKHPIENRSIGIRDPRWLPQEFKQYFDHTSGSSLFHLYGRESWTPNEKRLFLIADFDNMEEEQVNGGANESQYDLNSYKEYNPISKKYFVSNVEADTDEKRKKEKLKNIDRLYEEYLMLEKESCQLPQEYIKKRRFKITLDDLEKAGVNIEKMLDKNVFYDPNPELRKTDLLDKHNQRKVKTSDGLLKIKRKEL